MRTFTAADKAAAQARQERVIAKIVDMRAATFAGITRPVVQLTNDDEQWMDNPDAAINAGRFEADGFIPRNAVSPF